MHLQKKLVAFFVFALSLASPARLCAQNPFLAPIGEPSAPPPGLRLELIASKTQYEQGEPIEVTMRYSYAGTVSRLWVKDPEFGAIVGSARFGRASGNEFGFTAMDSAGKAVVDPTPWHNLLSSVAGSVRNNTLTETRSFEQRAVLNEWLRFDRPGRYQITAWSERVYFYFSPMERGGPKHVTMLKSEPMTLEILPPDEARRKERLSQARVALESKDETTRLQALYDLRIMVDPRTISLLLRGLDDTSSRAVNQAEDGLSSLPNQVPVKAALRVALSDDEHLIPPDKARLYILLLSGLDVVYPFSSGFGVAYPVSPASEKLLAPGKALYVKKLLRQINKLPSDKAAEMTVEGIGLGFLPRNDLQYWQRILDRVAAMDTAKQRVVGYLLESSTTTSASTANLKALGILRPELRQTAADTRLDPLLRSGAIVLLHALGDDSFRDLLFQDVTVPTPILTDAAHRTLGTYRAAAIGQVLLRLIDSDDVKVRQSAAQRLPDYSRVLPVADLERRVAAASDPEYGLLDALAIRSPVDALPFLQRSIEDPARERNRLKAETFRLLVRIDTPAARRLSATLFHSPDAADRQDICHALEESLREATEKKAIDYIQWHRMPPAPAVAASFFPELRTLFDNDPVPTVRQAAKRALQAIIGIPMQANYRRQETEAQDKAWIPVWDAWWQKNQVRYGR